MENNDCTCYTCKFWIKEYHSCFNGKSPYCAEFTKPEQSCTQWGEKKYKERLVKYERRVKGRYLEHG
jgi:hypothetical protein